MKASVVNLLSKPTSDAGKQRLLRLACTLLAMAACLAVARSSATSGALHAPALLRASTGIKRSLPPPLPNTGAAAAAYVRQREAGDRLLDSMRAAPVAWDLGFLHRATGAVWVDPFRDFYRCPGITEKVGALSDGGKWVCGVDTLLQRPDCVIYSFGSNGDTSFEEVLLQTTKCSVWTFDPTLNAAQQAKINAVPGLHFAPVGLADMDGDMDIAGKVRPVRTLATLMRERGHAWLDVLKMDIEGGEWAVLDGFVRNGSALPVSQAQIEFHVDKPQDAVETMAGLVGVGWRVFHVEENVYCGTDCAGKFYELSLAQVNAEDQIVTGL